MPNTAVLGEDNEKQLEEWIAEYSGAVLKLCFVYLADAEMAKDAIGSSVPMNWNSIPLRFVVSFC